jgi:Na+/H+ antiporter NhaD/arsenite permease-like protein
VACAIALLPLPASAGTLDGASLGWPWLLPLVGLVLSIAVGPLLLPRLWRRHYGKIAFVWGTLALSPLAALRGYPTALQALLDAFVTHYLGLIMLLLALYVVAGGILVTANLRGTPLVNAAFLAFGTLIASVVGTTGAAMILLRPLIRANAARLDNAHVVIFFILLVVNIGGAFSPLGSPPLILGLAAGADFLWIAARLWMPTAMVAGIVLGAFLVVDLWHYRRDRLITTVGESRPPLSLRVRGGGNLLLLAAIMGVVVAGALWRPGIGLELYGVRLELQHLVRDVSLMAIALASLALTPDEHREVNDFTWEPMIVVAALLAGLFACLVPVLAMLEAGHGGAFAWLAALLQGSSALPRDVASFWLTGAFAAVINNVPAYRTFLDLAGAAGPPPASALAAISMGAVYLGALTYLGNAPNLMVHALAVERGVRMPGFFGYLGWSTSVLLPPLLALTAVFLAPPSWRPW